MANDQLTKSYFHQHFTDLNHELQLQTTPTLQLHGRPSFGRSTYFRRKTKLKTPPCAVVGGNQTGVCDVFRLIPEYIPRCTPAIDSGLSSDLIQKTRAPGEMGPHLCNGKNVYGREMTKFRQTWHVVEQARRLKNEFINKLYFHYRKKREKDK
ncbi:uncharacterized protein LOC129738538 [Uranotaenia lowii]|uniref:uncharacterized protein LOC129738538 n=1 Tax=Uranotaenia lowii TaxID=190385 RepID=UPI002479B2F3|nr:uncharacterized protein LOC129738538 [Uranotaenia lowii]